MLTQGSTSIGTTRSLLSEVTLVAPPRDNSKSDMAEEEGFEPPRGLTRLSVFKTDPFSQTWVFLRNIISCFAYAKNSGGPCRTRTYDRTVMSRLL